jgi:hypothetical protein
MHCTPQFLAVLTCHAARPPKIFLVCGSIVANHIARKIRALVAMPDLGYRGVDAHNPDVHIVHRVKVKRLMHSQLTRG